MVYYFVNLLLKNFYSGQSRSLSLDLYDQYIYMEQNRQFRFTRM